MVYFTWLMSKYCIFGPDFMCLIESSFSRTSDENGAFLSVSMVKNIYNFNLDKSKLIARLRILSKV